MNQHALFLAYAPFAALWSVLLCGFVIVHVTEAREPKP